MYVHAWALNVCFKNELSIKIGLTVHAGKVYLINSHTDLVDV